MRWAKFTSFALALSMLLPTPVSAAELHDDGHTHVSAEEISESPVSRDTEVLYERASDFIVTIPKKIALSSSKNAAYDVKVKGSVLANEAVSVKPAETFFMHESKSRKSDVTAISSQTDTVWHCEDITDEGTIKSGSILAEKLTAGEWSGDMTFYINLEDESTHLNLSISDNVYLGQNGSVQVNAFVNDENANDAVTWTSSSDKITVQNGLVSVTDAAVVGDTAEITARYDIPQIASYSLDFSDVAMDGELSTKFTVTVVGAEFFVDGETADTVDIVAGDTKTVTAKLTPDVNGFVSWSCKENGAVAKASGNSVDVTIPDSAQPGEEYHVTASYGDFSKTFGFRVIHHYVHNYVGVVTTQPTCTQDGVKTFTCECGATYTEPVKALGHDFATEYTVDKAATCITAGSKSQHCKRCSATQNVISIVATGHNYGAPTYTWSADGKTCTATRVCKTDGSHKETESATITNVVKTAATCTGKGTHTYTATFKNSAFTKQTKDVQDIAALGHNFSSSYTVDRAAGHTTTGVKSQHCTRCSATQNATTIPATGHSHAGSLVNYNGVNYATASGGCYTTAKSLGYSCTRNYQKYGSAISNGYFTTVAYGGNGCPYCKVSSTQIITQFYSPTHSACGGKQNDDDKSWINYCGTCGRVTANGFGLSNGGSLPSVAKKDTHTYYLTRYALNCNK